MRTVRLHGELGKRFGRVHRLDVRTPAEALKAIEANTPGFAQFILESEQSGIAHKVVADRMQLPPEMLDAPFSRSVSITPVVSGGAPIGAFLVGTLLPAIGITGTLAGVIGTLAVALALKGIVSLLSPHAEQKAADATKKENPYFNGPENVTAQGSPVPMGYGRVIVGSVVISAGITVEQQSIYDTAIGGFLDGGVWP